MKKIIFLLGIFVIFFFVVTYFYRLGSKNLPKSLPDQITISSLVGIWQASGGMASGWNDRYHFYPNGNFHFYPNEMACEKEKVQLLGSWKIENKVLALTTKIKILDTMSCDKNGFGHLISQKTTELQKPETNYLPLVNLETIKDDIYPSIILGGEQYWQFSKDPSSYGSEKFSEK